MAFADVARRAGGCWPVLCEPALHQQNIAAAPAVWSRRGTAQQQCATHVAAKPPGQTPLQLNGQCQAEGILSGLSNSEARPHPRLAIVCSGPFGLGREGGWEVLPVCRHVGPVHSAQGWQARCSPAAAPALRVQKARHVAGRAPCTSCRIGASPLHWGTYSRVLPQRPYTVYFRRLSNLNPVLFYRSAPLGHFSRGTESEAWPDCTHCTNLPQAPNCAFIRDHLRWHRNQGA